VPQELHHSRTDAAGRAIDQNLLAGGELHLVQKVKRIVRSFEACRRLRIAHVLRNLGDCLRLAYCDIFGLRGKALVVKTKHALALLKEGNFVAHRDNFAGKVGARYWRRGFHEPGEEPHDEGFARHDRAVGAVHGCGVNLN
jgi:hypothetical protein